MNREDIFQTNTSAADLDAANGDNGNNGGGNNNPPTPPAGDDKNQPPAGDDKPVPPAGDNNPPTPPVPPVPPPAGDDEGQDDEVEPTFDAEGNVVDETGKIIQTKDEYEEEQIRVHNESQLTAIQTVMGIQVFNPDGTPKVYEATEDGYNAYLADAVAVSKQQGIAELFKAMPDLAEYYKVRAMGGNPADFFKEEVDYSKINVEGLSDDQKVNLLIDFNKSNGLTEEAAKKMAKRSVDAKAVDEDVKEALDVMKSRQALDKQNKEAALVEQRRKQIEATEKEWKAIENEVVNVGKIGNFVLPIPERKAFFEYIGLDADGKGNSQAHLDALKRPKELSMLIDYLYGFKKGDTASIIRNLQGQVKHTMIKGMRTKPVNSGATTNTKTPTVNSNKLPEDRDILFTTGGQ